ncbi:hypothetical protein [Nocardioides sp.]|uniref:hypothetical protein n=1 Tax=Nocardioides sp. TaxID=35761 RepID=UPI003510EAC7
MLNVAPTVDKLLAGWQPHDVLGPFDDRAYRLVLDPRHGDWLTSLRQHYRLAWCTTWWRVADQRIAPLLGLTPLRHAVPLPPTPAAHHVDADVSAKTPHVRAWANGAPLAWIDDDIDQRDADALLAPAPDDTRPPSTTPCSDVLLLRTDPAEGLQPHHVDRLLSWTPRTHADATPPDPTEHPERHAR